MSTTPSNPVQSCQPITNELRNVVAGRERQISPDEAKEIALRLIAGAFGRTDMDKRPRFSIPCKPWDDDDCLIIEFIKQSTTLTARVDELEKALRGAHRVLQILVGPGDDHLSSMHVYAQAVAAECESRAVLQPKGAAV